MAMLQDGQRTTMYETPIKYWPGDQPRVATGGAETTNPSPVTMGDLYTRNPGVAQAASPTSIPTRQATAASAGSTDTQAARVASEGYKPELAELTDDMKVDAELNRIMAQDSPAMRLARQQGLLTAARRGLENSSIAAGTAQAELVKAGLPMAQQNAAGLLEVALRNQEAQNRGLEFGSEAANRAALASGEFEQRANESTAEARNRAALFNAENQTNVSLANATEQNRANQLLAQLQQETNLSNALSDNRMRELVVSANAELNRQYLTGTQTMDLAQIEGQYKQLIAASDVAARMYQSYFDSIAQSMANKDIAPSRLAEMIGMQQKMLQSGLDLMNSIYQLDINEALGMPRISASGNVGGATTPPTTGTPTTSTPTTETQPGGTTTGGTTGGGGGTPDYMNDPNIDWSDPRTWPPELQEQYGMLYGGSYGYGGYY